MEANIQIKRAEVEGNKVKDLEFYGDWELDIAEKGEVGPIYVECPMQTISANTWKAGMFTVTVNTWTSSEHSVNLSFKSVGGYKNASFVELYSSNSKADRVTISAGRSVTISTTTKTIYGIFKGGSTPSDGGMTTMIGYVFLDVTDGSTTFEYTEV